MRAKKIDLTHHAIANQIRAIGYSVLSLAPIGRGVADLLVANGGFAALVECKSKGGRLTEDQKRFHASWKGLILTVYTPEEAEEKLGAAYADFVAGAQLA